VSSGTINGTQSFLMIAEKVGSETLLSQIVQMVSDASRSRAPIQNLVDRIAKYFVPVVVVDFSDYIFRMVVNWSRTQISLCLCKCNCGFHYCLSLCIRIGYANVGNGRSRERCKIWRY
jgi:cation transport ATPase